jgi:DUF971 family protein
MSNPSYVAPLVIRRSDPARVDIEWSDGTKSGFTAPELRGLCPCAQCVSETTGVRMIDPERVPGDLTQSNLAMVGNYAISMRFSDGHHTGIFTFEYLLASDPDRQAPGGR